MRGCLVSGGMCPDLCLLCWFVLHHRWFASMQTRRGERGKNKQNKKSLKISKVKKQKDSWAMSHCWACERSAAFPDNNDVQCLGSCENTICGWGRRGGPSLVWCFWLCERSLQVSAAFLLEPFVLPSAPSAFLELLEERLTAAAIFVSESISWVWLSPPSSSSCSIQHSCPVGGQGRSAPSWWALQKELGQSWQKASEFFPQTSQWCQGQSQRPVESHDTFTRAQSVTSYQRTASRCPCGALTLREASILIK